MEDKNKMPVVFIGHGTPMNMIEDNPWTPQWADLGKELASPKSILVISAHWFSDKTSIQEDAQPDVIYDYYGFPSELYEVRYPAKTDQALVSRVKNLLGPSLNIQDRRGYDHGAYSVLLSMYPKAEIPVTQLSINQHLNAKDWFEIGKKLSPLREEGILILGSGNLVHNLITVNPKLGDQAYPDCVKFEKKLLSYLDRDSNLEEVFAWEDFQGASLSAEYPDHLAPFFYCLGAVDEERDQVENFCQDYLWGSMSMTSLVWGRS